MLQVAPAPSPIRPLDNNLSGAALEGANTFRDPRNDLDALRCRDCHVLAPGSGFFGANGRRSSANQTQQFKVPHLRNLYTKVGMFGMAQVPFLRGGNNGHQGPQVRGFGFLHDGSVDTMFRFLGAEMFTGLVTRNLEALEQFMFAFPTNYAPIVGQQVTLSESAAEDVAARIDLLVTRARTAFPMPDELGACECDLVVHGTARGQRRAWLGEPPGGCDSGQPLVFRGDRVSDPVLTDAQLRALATGADRLTWTCVPPGSGRRIALDRDEDGHFDRDEIDAGSDPANPLSVPATPARPTATAAMKKLSIRDHRGDDESRRKVNLASRDAGIVLPAPGSPGDPTCNGDPEGTVRASLTLSSASSGQVHRTNLPCQNWERLGTPGSPQGYRYRDHDLVDGTVRCASWLDGRFTATLSGRGAFFLDYDLVQDVSQGTVDAVFASDGTSLCFACAASDGEDGSGAQSFAGRSCPAPAACGLF
jgi:hypothetical protein